MILPFRALWTEELYVQQRRTQCSAWFELQTVRWFYQLKQAFARNNGVRPEHVAGKEANLTQREKNLLVEVERRTMSRYRQRSAEEPQADESNAAGEPYYVPGDPVNPPESDDEDWADEEDIAEMEQWAADRQVDRSDEHPGGSWITFVSLPPDRADAFKKVMRKDGALCRLLAPGVEGVIDRARDWKMELDTGRVYCVRLREHGCRLVVVVAVRGPYDKGALWAWANANYDEGYPPPSM